MLKAKVKEFSERDEKSIGLTDGGHIYLRCSSCDKGLADIYITQPEAIDPKTGEVFEWKAKAKCCYCGDQSYAKEFKGKFHLAGFGKIKVDDSSETIPETAVDYFDEENGTLIIYTIEANE